MKALVLIAALFSGMTAMAGTLSMTAAAPAPPTITLLPVPVETCVQVTTGDPSAPALPKESIQLPPLGLQWQGGTLTLTYALIELDSPDLSAGKFQQYISDDELTAVMGGKTTFNPGDKIQTVCNLRAGGITFLNPKQASTLQGTVTIEGYSPDANGNNQEVKAVMQFNGQFNGEP